MTDVPMPSSDAGDVFEIYLSPTWLPALLVADELEAIAGPQHDWEDLEP